MGTLHYQAIKVLLNISMKEEVDQILFEGGGRGVIIKTALLRHFK